MGMQYLSNIYQLDKNMIDVMVRVPDCMQLISQFKCRRLFLYEVPNSIHLLTCTSFKPLRIMEDKVASRVCNLVLNVMYSSLKTTYFSCPFMLCHMYTPQLMGLNMDNLQKVQEVAFSPKDV